MGGVGLFYTGALYAADNVRYGVATTSGYGLLYIRGQDYTIILVDLRGIYSYRRLVYQMGATGILAKSVRGSQGAYAQASGC